MDDELRMKEDRKSVEVMQDRWLGQGKGTKKLSTADRMERIK